MKSNNIILVFLLIFISISRNSDNESGTESQPTNTILVKKNIRAYSVNDISTLTYIYHGNKIVRASNDFSFVPTYTYTINVITKIEETVKGGYQNSREYFYLNGKLDFTVYKDHCDPAYTFNSNGKMSCNKMGSENTAGVPTISNGNVIKTKCFM